MSDPNATHPSTLAELLGAYSEKLVASGIDHELAGQIVLDAARKAHSGELGWPLERLSS